MNRFKIVAIILLFIGLGLLVGFVYNKTLNKPKENIHYISLLADKIEPNAIIIKVGEVVQFNTKDGRIHNIAQGAGAGLGSKHDHTEGGLESGNFNADEGYRVSFKKVGTYEFHDHDNPKLFVTIVVYKNS